MTTLKPKYQRAIDALLAGDRRKILVPHTAAFDPEAGARIVRVDTADGPAIMIEEWCAWGGVAAGSRMSPACTAYLRAQLPEGS